MQNPGVGGQSGETITVTTRTPLTPLTPANATVTGTSSQVLAANTSRKGLTIVNLSSDNIFLGYGSNAAVLNKGDALTQTGSTYNSGEYDFFTGAVNAISSGTSSLISIQEFQ